MDGQIQSPEECVLRFVSPESCRQDRVSARAHCVAPREAMAGSQSPPKGDGKPVEGFCCEATWSDFHCGCFVEKRM